MNTEIPTLTISGPEKFLPKAVIEDMALIAKVLEIYDQKQIAELLNKECGGNRSRETVNRWIKGKMQPKLSHIEFQTLSDIFPKKPKHYGDAEFTFIDLFAGIGGIRKGFDDASGECVCTSEWNKFSVKTYKANHYCGGKDHRFNSDIRDMTLSHLPEISDEEAYAHIDQLIPDHDVLLAGFP